MQDIKKVVNMARAKAIQQELPKCFEDKLNGSIFIVRAVQNAIAKEAVDCFECVIYKDTIIPLVCEVDRLVTP